MKVDRLVSIIMILLERERISAKELAGMFEVSMRTIYRDVDAINLAGIPVCSTPGVGGGFEIMKSYKVDKKIFSSSDLSAILMGLSGMSGMFHGDELANATAKVKSFIPAEKARDIELMANQLYIDLSPWNSNRNIQPYLEIIKTAMTERRLISFDYIDRYGNISARTAEPYQLVLKNSRWYCQGYCMTRDDFRLFKLTRMSKLRMLVDEYEPREYPNPRLEFDDTPAASQSRVTIRIHKSLMDQALDYCSYDSFIPDGEEHYIVSFPFMENDYYYNILISLGGKCECLEPEHICTELHRRLEHLGHYAYDREANISIGKTIFPAGQLDKIEFVTIYAEYDGKWVYCWHRRRKSYEHPGGHVEDGETPMAAAKRELYEEAGVTDCTITPLWDYEYIWEDGSGRNNGRVYYARVNALGTLPDSEMSSIELFDSVPGNYTYDVGEEVGELAKIKQMIQAFTYI